MVLCGWSTYCAPFEPFVRQSNGLDFISTQHHPPVQMNWPGMAMALHVAKDESKYKMSCMCTLCSLVTYEFVYLTGYELQIGIHVFTCSNIHTYVHTVFYFKKTLWPDSLEVHTYLGYIISKSIKYRIYTTGSVVLLIQTLSIL